MERGDLRDLTHVRPQKVEEGAEWRLRRSDVLGWQRSWR